MSRASRDSVRKIAENVCFLAGHGIALRVNGDETDSNFPQLLLLRGKDDEQLIKRVERKGERCTIPEIQNELLSLLTLSVSRGIARDVQEGGIFALMADEVTVASNKEQVTVCCRHVGIV